MREDKKSKWGGRLSPNKGRRLGCWAAEVHRVIFNLSQTSQGLKNSLLKREGKKLIKKIGNLAQQVIMNDPKKS